MGKWPWILLAAFVALAVLGFVIDALRFLIGVALVACAIVIAFRFLTARGRKRSSE